MPGTSNERFVCVHGHFYQPPRENPWLEAVEVQDSAAPYHDWNERVTAECYTTNAAARLLDDRGYITALRNNYNRVSFNFGPTLLAWMATTRPNEYAQILLADRESSSRLGRGNAIAQVYGHCIMPLATRRDQHTQVRWGIADFVHRFGRQPDGMWLPETAVDRATLAVLAENGIRFTILAPSQAARVRSADGAWQPVQDGQVDGTRPYRCVVGPGRDIIVFFYDAEISRAVAFGGLLNDGREFARRLMAASPSHAGKPLVHIATDGETYGHHHRFGEMALAAAIDTIEREHQVQLTNYAAYLDRVPVRDEAEVRDHTSWSCAHGVERWRAHCGCNAGHTDWQQTWRTPLRHALDWLEVQLDGLFERQAEKLLRDPWAARDAYVDVVLQRDREHQETFIERHTRAQPQGRERSRLWKLLEMQRHAMLSFTSCGWFFDDPSGLETVQVLTYAARAIQLAGEFGANIEPEFLRRLQPMRSNVPQYSDGRQLYRELVRPLLTDGSRMVAHYAMDSVLTPPAPTARCYAYRVTALDRRLERAGAASFATGRTRLEAAVTEDSEEYVYAALHLGGHDMHCAVARGMAATDYAQLKGALVATFVAEPLTELVRRMDHAFGGTFYTLRDVFVAERRRILGLVTAQALAECTAYFERMVTSNRRLLDFLAQAQVPMPEALCVAATFVVERRLEQAAADFVAATATAEPLLAAWADAQRWGVKPQMANVQATLEQALVRAVIGLGQGDAETHVARAHAILDVAHALPLALNTWEAQNQYYVFITTDGAQRWSVAAFDELRRLGERLQFHLREWESFNAHAA